MNKLFSVFVIITSLFLVGCNSTQQLVTTTKIQVAMPPDALFSCPIVKLPNADTATNVDIARALSDLYHTNKKCANNINAIKKFLNDAQASLGSN